MKSVAGRNIKYTVVREKDSDKLHSKPKAFSWLEKAPAIVRKICPVNKGSNLHWNKKKGALKVKPHPTKILVNEKNSLKEFSAPGQEQELL